MWSGPSRPQRGLHPAASDAPAHSTSQGTDGSKPHSSAQYLWPSNQHRRPSGESLRCQHHRPYEGPPTLSSRASTSGSLSLAPPPPATDGLWTSYLHPTHRQPVKETHLLDIDHDPVSGQKTINSYQIKEEIGRGVHGKVKLGVSLKTGEQVAIKIVDRHARPRLGRPQSANSQEVKVRREIAILKKCSHPNVVRLIEVIDDPTANKVYLVLEFVELGEVQWRKHPTDFDIVKREARRLRRERMGLPDLPDPEAIDERPRLKRSHNRRRRKTLNNALENDHCWSLELGGLTDEEMDSPSSRNDSEISESEEELDYREDCSYIPALTMEQARTIFRDTVLGLEYLHFHGIIHRDIKPANLLWTKNRRVKISDFGVSYLGAGNLSAGSSRADNDAVDLELAKTAGTPAFFAPELCCVGLYTDAELLDDRLTCDADFNKPRARITSAIDVWALGVTLYCLIYARVPFLADGELELFKVIESQELFVPHRRVKPEMSEARPATSYRERRRNPTLLDLETEIVPPELDDLLRRLLTKDPTKRITLKEVKQHPWVLQGIVNPQVWLEETDPAKSNDGRRIEVSSEDLDTAVTFGVFGKVKSVIKKIVGTLRKRASSSANVGRKQLHDSEVASVRESIRTMDEFGETSSTIDASEYRGSAPSEYQSEYRGSDYRSEYRGSAPTERSRDASSIVSRWSNYDAESQLTKLLNSRGPTSPGAHNRQLPASSDGPSDEPSKKGKSSSVGAPQSSASSLRRGPSNASIMAALSASGRRSSPVSPLANHVESVSQELRRVSTSGSKVGTSSTSLGGLVSEAGRKMARVFRRSGKGDKKSTTSLTKVDEVRRTVSAQPPTNPVDIASAGVGFSAHRGTSEKGLSPRPMHLSTSQATQTTQASTLSAASITSADSKHMRDVQIWDEMSEARKAKQRQEITNLLAPIDRLPLSPEDLTVMANELKARATIGPITKGTMPSTIHEGKLASSSSDEQLQSAHTPATTVSSSLTENTSYPSVPSMLTASSSLSDHVGLGWTSPSRIPEEDEKTVPYSAVPSTLRSHRDTDSGYCIAEGDVSSLHSRMQPPSSAATNYGAPLTRRTSEEDEESDPDGFFINFTKKSKASSRATDKDLPPLPLAPRKQTLSSSTSSKEGRGEREKKSSSGKRRSSRSAEASGQKRERKRQPQPPMPTLQSLGISFDGGEMKMH